MWYQIAKIGMVEDQLDRRCKEVIRTSPFFARMFKHFGVNVRDAWNLHFRVKRMHDSHAATQGNYIYLDEDVIQTKGLEKAMFLVAHELTHWLTRMKEKLEYFADPEETDAFNWSIAHELSQGRGWDEIEDTFLPLISLHIKDHAKAKKFLIERFRDANRHLN